MKLFYFFLLSVILTSCGKFSDGTSIWSDGLWVIPTITFLASVGFLYTSWRMSRSGGKRQLPQGGWEYTSEPVSVFKIGRFWFGVGLLIATIIIIIVQNWEK